MGICWAIASVILISTAVADSMVAKCQIQNKDWANQKKHLCWGHSNCFTKYLTFCNYDGQCWTQWLAKQRPNNKIHQDIFVQLHKCARRDGQPGKAFAEAGLTVTSWHLWHSIFESESFTWNELKYLQSWVGCLAQTIRPTMIGCCHGEKIASFQWQISCLHAIYISGWSIHFPWGTSKNKCFIQLRLHRGVQATLTISVLVVFFEINSIWLRSSIQTSWGLTFTFWVNSIKFHSYLTDYHLRTVIYMPF